MFVSLQGVPVPGLLAPVSDVDIFLGLHDLSDPNLTGDFKYEGCHLT